VQWKTKKKSNFRQIPEKGLSRNKKAKVSFQGLPPSHKREYIEAIVEAKKPETRLRRIKQAVVILAKSKR